MAISIVLLLVYSAFCCWAIFMRGADVLSGYVISGRSGEPFTPRKVKVYLAAAWFVWLGIALLQVFFGPRT